VFNYGLSKSYTPLTWSEIVVDPDWELAETTLCTLDDQAYVFGDLLSEVVGPSGTKGYTFSLSNDWNWIEPWNLGRIVSIVVDVFWCGVSSRIPVLEEYIRVLNYLGFLQDTEDFLFSSPQLKYAYTGLGDATTASQDNVHVWIKPEKIVFYWLNIGSAILAGEFTTAGFAALPIPFVGWAIAAALFASEAAAYVCSEVFYVLAVDPDSNFTELASPQPWHEPVLDTLPLSSSKTAAELTFNMLSIAQALKSSYARYLGALRAGSYEWATIQLGATRYYTQLEIPIAQQLESVTQIIVDSIPIPSPEQIAAIRDSLMQNGLPEVEVEIMHRLGFTDEEIDSLTAIYIRADDIFYTSFVKLPEMAEYFEQSLQSLVAALPEPPGQAQLANLGTYPDTLETSAPPPLLNCWVEFPNDSDLTGYQIISAVLNDTVEATYISPTPGDYDADGIDDIAMQFDPTSLLPTLQGGQQLLSVLGYIILPSSDTVLYSGACLVTILTFKRGDANGDGVINSADVAYLINYLFVNGPAPVPLQAGDANCDGNVNSADVAYLINYLFVSGPPPGC
jgi:hypothetical protein